MVSPETVKSRLIADLFSQPLMDNALRGYWCEAMVAEAIGPECNVVGQGWHPWDLQIGDDVDTLPERIRIQVKNSAKLQPWNKESGRVSNTQFDLKWRRKPSYFTQNNPNTPCEDEGFLADLFVLCHHPVSSVAVCDHRDPEQWEFYLLPVAGLNSGVAPAETALLRKKLEKSGKPATLQKRPATLGLGIRRGHPCHPIGISDLHIDALRTLF